MKQKMINALYILKECARRSVTSGLEYLFCSMLALAVTNISDDAGVLRLILVIACVLLAAVLNADQGIRVGKKHFQMYLSGEIRRNSGIETVNNADRKTYKREMEYAWYKGLITGVIICVPLVICCVVYGVGGYFDNENIQSLGNFVMVLLCGWAIIPLTLIFGSVNVLWTLCFCVLPVTVSAVSYIVGKNLEQKAYEEREARLESVRRGEKPVSNREKKRAERENRRFH